MTEKKDRTQETEVDQFDFMNETSAKIKVTYSHLFKTPVEMVFHMRLMLDSEQRELRQAHFALSEDEQELKQHTYNVDMLSRLSTALPDGIPGLSRPKHLRVDLTDVRQMMATFFEDGSNPMKTKIASSALNLYYAALEPDELFFRN